MQFLQERSTTIFLTIKQMDYCLTPRKNAAMLYKCKTGLALNLNFARAKVEIQQASSFSPGKTSAPMTIDRISIYLYCSQNYTLLISFSRPKFCALYKTDA